MPTDSQRACHDRPFTLFTGQWADLPFEEVAKLASGWGYDGLEIAVSGDHLGGWRWEEPGYVDSKLEILAKYNLKVSELLHGTGRTCLSHIQNNANQRRSKMFTLRLGQYAIALAAALTLSLGLVRLG